MKMLILLLVLALIAGWYFLRRDDASKPATTARPDRRVSTGDSSKYHAVGIKFPAYACDAAKALAGKRFLSGEAPDIPLPDCDGRECECTFIHFKDRRTGKDRRSPFTPAGFGSGTGKFDTERRAGKDRRGADIDYEL